MMPPISKSVIDLKNGVDLTRKLKIFVLGDSRTGTTSVHEYLLRSGLRSIHYYMEEAGVTHPAHRAKTANWVKVHRFIEQSQFEAFSDFPTRLFYREIMTTYPKAFFIHTTRRDSLTWRKSMMALPNVGKDNIELLYAYHLCYNEEIRAAAYEFGLNFLDICIEDHPAENSGKISEFLSLPLMGPLLQLNTADDLAASGMNSAAANLPPA